MTLPTRVLLEVASPDGEMYVLTRGTNDERYRQSAQDVYVLSRRANPSGRGSRAVRRATVAGAVAVSVALASLCYAVLPTHGDGLTPKRVDFGPCMLCLVPGCFAPIGLLLGSAIGRRRQQRRPTFEAILGRNLSINGVDAGPLVSVTSDIPARSVVLATAGRETRIELATESDAVLLADALERRTQ